MNIKSSFLILLLLAVSCISISAQSKRESLDFSWKFMEAGAANFMSAGSASFKDLEPLTSPHVTTYMGRAI